MSPQAAVRRFPGYGIVYLEKGEGIKVVRTYTQAPAKVIEGDGSVSYTTPPPTIHELFGGGFCYENGISVNDKIHLENITDGKMRERALKWFSGERVLSEVARRDIPSLPDPDERKPGEVVYLTSSDLEKEDDPVTRKLNERVKAGKEEPVLDPISALSAQIMALANSVNIVVTEVKEQGKQISELKKRPPAPRRMAMSDANHTKQSVAMKARWADPEYKAKMMAKNPALRGKVKSGQESPKGDQAV